MMYDYNSGKTSAEAYLVLDVDTYKWGDQTTVRGVRIDRMTKGKPKLNPGEIVVKVKLNFEKKQLVDSIPVVELDVNNFHVEKSPQAQIVEEIGYEDARAEGTGS